MANKINVLECGPRDGWQNLKQMLTFEQKLDLIDRLFDAGVTQMEVTSFVSPKAIPQMADAADLAKACIEKFNAKQIISLLSIVLMLVLLIFVKVNIGVAAFAVAGLLFLFGVADDGKALKSLPWGTIVMVLAVGSLLNIVNKMGGIDLMSNALAKIMSKGTATPFMGISAALLSLVSSALGVVYPTMMPMCADIAAQVGGVNPVALMAAVGAGGSLSGISPLSTGGALAMAALATALPNRTKEDENKTFVQLFIYAGLAILILIVLCSTIYVPLANLLHGA